MNIGRLRLAVSREVLDTRSAERFFVASFFVFQAFAVAHCDLSESWIEICGIGVVLVEDAVGMVEVD